MKINGIDKLSSAELQQEVERGGKFVIYQYCISALIVTFKRPSDIYFIRPGQNAVVKGLPFTLLSLFLGWWGIPWGPIYTIGSFVTNFGGGKDVTLQVIGSVSPARPVAS